MREAASDATTMQAVVKAEAPPGTDLREFHKAMELQSGEAIKVVMQPE